MRAEGYGAPQHAATRVDVGKRARRGQPWLVLTVLGREETSPGRTVCLSRLLPRLWDVCFTSGRCVAPSDPGDQDPLGSGDFLLLCPHREFPWAGLSGLQPCDGGEISVTQTPSGLEMGEEEMG